MAAARLGRGAPADGAFGVALLEVYGRDLQIAVARHDDMAAFKALGFLHQNWNRLRPLLPDTDASLRAWALRFDGLLQRAGGASGAAQMAQNTDALLGAVDELEAQWTRPRAEKSP